MAIRPNPLCVQPPALPDDLESFANVAFEMLPTELFQQRQAEETTVKTAPSTTESSTQKWKMWQKVVLGIVIALVIIGLIVMIVLIVRESRKSTNNNGGTSQVESQAGIDRFEYVANEGVVVWSTGGRARYVTLSASNGAILYTNDDSMTKIGSTQQMPVSGKAKVVLPLNESQVKLTVFDVNGTPVSKTITLKQHSSVGAAGGVALVSPVVSGVQQSSSGTLLLSTSSSDAVEVSGSADEMLQLVSINGQSPLVFDAIVLKDGATAPLVVAVNGSAPKSATYSVEFISADPSLKKYTVTIGQPSSDGQLQVPIDTKRTAIPVVGTVTLVAVDSVSNRRYTSAPVAYTIVA